MKRKIKLVVQITQLKRVLHPLKSLVDPYSRARSTQGKALAKSGLCTAEILPRAMTKKTIRRGQGSMQILPRIRPSYYLRALSSNDIQGDTADLGPVLGQGFNRFPALSMFSDLKHESERFLLLT